MLMKVSLDSLIPYEKLKNSLSEVLDLVEEKGHVVILKNNEPAFIISDYKSGLLIKDEQPNIKRSDYTLQEAMKIVLMEQEDQQLHAAKLADEIYKRGLYYKKNGEKAQYNQIRARANHYPELFKPLAGNIIKLKTK
jgi:antitoxin Phd